MPLDVSKEACEEIILVLTKVEQRGLWHALRLPVDMRKSKNGQIEMKWCQGGHELQRNVDVHGRILVWCRKYLGYTWVRLRAKRSSRVSDDLLLTREMER